MVVFWFLWAWVRSIFAATGLWGRVVKWVTFALLAVFAVANRDRLVLGVRFPAQGEVEGDKWAIEIPVYVGVLVASLFGVVVICCAAGATWVRFSVLRVAPEVEDNNGWYQLRITNCGYFPVQVLVRLEEVANKDGPVATFNADLPLRLRWLHNGDQPTLSLSRGLPEKAILFQLNGWSGKNRSSASQTALVIDGIGGRVNLGLLGSTPDKCLWLKFSFGSVDQVKWFSVRTTGNSYGFVVREERPPHLG